MLFHSFLSCRWLQDRSLERHSWKPTIAVSYFFPRPPATPSTLSNCTAAVPLTRTVISYSYGGQRIGVMDQHLPNDLSEVPVIAERIRVGSSRRSKRSRAAGTVIPLLSAAERAGRSRIGTDHELELARASREMVNEEFGGQLPTAYGHQRLDGITALLRRAIGKFWLVLIVHTVEISRAAFMLLGD